MASLKEMRRRYRGLGRLAERIADLEAEVQECRQLNLRLAELCDVTMELLLPIADQDRDRVEEVLARYRQDLNDPLNPANG
jgi:hypothetical protein